MRSAIFLLVCTAVLNCGGATNQPAALPSFHYQGVILRASDLKYKPHDDIIYPSVVRAEGRLKSPHGKYYMYYAPHDNPGGVCVAFADRPEGPWREYTNNPVISRDWAPYYQVSHVSGPDVIWQEGEGQLFLYFHGENPVTRLATSDDGIHFKYEGEVVNTGMFKDVSEASYGRVCERRRPGQEPDYVMLLMGNNQGIRRIYLATSKDGRKWQARPEPFLSPPPGNDQVAGAIHIEWQGRHYLLFHANNSQKGFSSGFNLYLAETDAAFSSAWHLGKFMDRTFAGPDNPAVMSPFVLRENQRLYLYFNIGARLRNQIALAISE